MGKVDHFERYKPISLRKFKADRWGDRYDYHIEYYDHLGYTALLIRGDRVRDEMEAYTKAQAQLDKFKADHQQKHA